MPTPVLTTIHGFSSAGILPVFKKYNARTGFVAISDADRHPELDYLATIHHGIDTGTFALQASTPATTCCSSGASIPTKGRCRPSKLPLAPAYHC